MQRMIAAGVVLASLTACERDPHPERFIRVYTGGAGDSISVFVFQDRYLEVTGAWTMEGEDKIATPVNVATIRCEREQGTCRENTADIINMAGNTWLTNQEGTYQISSWTPEQVIARNAGTCRAVEIRIDIPGNRVSQIVENTPGGSCELHPTGPLPRARISRLISSEQLEEMRKSKAF